MGGERHVRFFQLSTPQGSNADDHDDDDDERVEKRRRCKLQAIPLVIFFLLFVSVLVPFVSNNKPIDALRFFDRKNATGAAIANPNMLVSLSGMNTENYEMTVTAVLNNVPTSVLNAQGTRITTPFRIQVGANVAVYNENTSYIKAPLTSKVPLLTGSLAWYPFDKYLMKLEIQAVTGTSQFNGGSYSPLDNFAFVVLWPDDFSWTYTVRPTVASDFADVAVGSGSALSDPTIGYTALTVEITRDFNIYMALVFVGIWSVTIAIGYIGSRAVIWKTRAPDNPVIFVSALFAVPTFRNTTPGRPPYGCLFDVLCTYFSICVIVTFLVLVAFAYMRKPKTDKPKKRRRREDDDTVPVATLDAGPVGDVSADVGDVGDAGADGGTSDATASDSA